MERHFLIAKLRGSCAKVRLEVLRLLFRNLVRPGCACPHQGRGRPTLVGTGSTRSLINPRSVTTSRRGDWPRGRVSICHSFPSSHASTARFDQGRRGNHPYLGRGRRAAGHSFRPLDAGGVLAARGLPPPDCAPLVPVTGHPARIKSRGLLSSIQNGGEGVRVRPALAAPSAPRPPGMQPRCGRSCFPCLTQGSPAVRDRVQTLLSQGQTCSTRFLIKPCGLLTSKRDSGNADTMELPLHPNGGSSASRIDHGLRGNRPYHASRAEGQLPVLGTDLHAVARFEVAGEQLHRERVEQMFLDGALEGTRAELRIVAFL